MRETHEFLVDLGPNRLLLQALGWVKIKLDVSRQGGLEHFVSVLAVDLVPLGEFVASNDQAV